MSITNLSKYIAEQIIIDEISRIDMPQIKGDNIPDALSTFKKYGVPYIIKVINPNELLPIQSDYIPKKVDDIELGLINAEKMNPIFISMDNFIIDGHHRWLAYKRLNIPMKVIQVKYPKNAALKLFNKLETKLNENVSPIQKTIVIYPGRFQPFHKGHYYSYSDLVSKFGKNNVYIATSNKTESGKSPFSFKDKKEIITKLFGIPSSKIVQVKNPYRPEEILKNFDSKTTAVVIAVGEKDASRLGGKYYIPYKGKVESGYLDKGYVYLVPQLQLKINGKTISGTEVRNNFNKDLFKGLYPKYDKSLYDMMKQKLSESLIVEGVFVKCEICNELHKDLSRHLIKHNITGIKYKEKYPGSKLVSEEKRNKNRLGGKISGPLNKGNKRPDLSERNKNPEFIKKISDGIRQSYNKNPELRQLRSEQFKNKELRNKIKETNYSNGNWKRPEDKPEYINYLDKVRTITTENYNKYFYEIKDAKKRSRDYHLDHKYSIHSGFVNNIPPEVIGHYKNLEILHHSLNESKFNKNSITLEQLILDIQNSKNPLDNKILLLCGGAFGHLKHPFEDMDLTFGDMKNMIKLALEGKLELTQEKTDGQNLLFSWIDGKLRAARNASHTKNFGKNSLDISGVSNMFSGRGEIHTAFVEALNDLQSAISKLSEKQRQKIFANGKKFMSVEVIYPQTTNVIPYNYAMLVFHGTFEYDEQGNKIGADKSEATLLANMIKQINADVQNTFKIRAPNNLRLPKVQNFSSQKSYFLGKLNKLQQEFGLKDSDSIIMYHQKWWENFINNKYTLPNNIVSDLVKRWAYNDKSVKIVDIKNKIAKLNKPEILSWVDKFDKTEYTNQAKQNLRKFESIFLELGAKILKNINIFLAANPDQALNQLRSSLDKSIKDIENSNDISAINKLKTQLERLEALGGFDAIVPSEGITFMFNGNLYKLTGAFAPINQILGILRY